MTKPEIQKGNPSASQTASKKKTGIIVQKYGGATLADPKKIKQIAQRISDLAKSGTKVVAAVSAMGKTTNQLIDLANQVSGNPNRRELDMLLTTGERVSMALVSMALHDLNCDAISFTGSQAGILTNDSHVNACIIDVKAHRVLEALHQNKVVVLAGFQGVSPTSKEITTLGRGGTDTTAIAMAAFLEAERCEILKDVAGVFTADPKIVPEAQAIKSLTYDQMLEMTFWGAKVLHYRSVELAKQKNVNIYIGPASSHLNDGTTIPSPAKEPSVFETSKILGLNSHSQVLEIEINSSDSSQAHQLFQKFLDEKEIAAPQILLINIDLKKQTTTFFVTGPSEIMLLLTKETQNNSQVCLMQSNLCTVTATCTGVTSPELTSSILNLLEKNQIKPSRLQFSAMSVSVYLEQSQNERALQALHALI